MHRYLTSSLMSSSPRWLFLSSSFLRPSPVGLLKLPPLPKSIKRNYFCKPINVCMGTFTSSLMASSLLLSSFLRPSPFALLKLPPLPKQIKRNYCRKPINVVKGKFTCEEHDSPHILWWKEVHDSPHILWWKEVHDSPHILWWKENMEKFKKPSTVQLVTRLKYSNLLGLDVNLKNGSLKEGTLNMELLQFKSKFPREVLLCRVGDFYEAIGFDACVLVEHAGLNPFGGLRSDSIPRAGCPVVNLRQTLDDLTRSGFSVCIVEEVQGPTQGRSRNGRFISSHAHPGCPYPFGLAGVDHDVDFPEPMPVVGHLKGLVEEWDSLKTTSSFEIDFKTKEVLRKKLEDALAIICQKKIIELYERKRIREIGQVYCVAVGVKELPPPSTGWTTSIYIHFRPDKTVYVGLTGDLIKRVRALRSKAGMKSSKFVYFKMPEEGNGRQLKSLLINELTLQGFRRSKAADVTREIANVTP